MQTYNLKAANESHLVYFRKPEPNRVQFYYDFETRGLVRVTPVMRLPYKMVGLRLLGDGDAAAAAEADDFDEEGVVTAHDSFRLFDSEENVDHDAMLKEKEWRDALSVGSELEYKLNSVCLAKRLTVASLKSDIIPRVLGCSTHHLHQDSRSLFPQGTHLASIAAAAAPPVFDAENAYESRLAEAVAAERRVLPKLKLRRLPSVAFYDPLPLYRRFSMYEPEITMRDIEALHPMQSNTDESLLGVLGLLTLAREHDMCWVRNRIDVDASKSCAMLFARQDAISDIAVHNASYAYLRATNGQCCTVPLTLDEDGAFRLAGNSHDVPIFPSLPGREMVMHTDGSHLTFRSIWMQMLQRELIMKMTTKWAVSHIGTKLLLIGHAWAPSAVIDMREVEEATDAEIELARH